MAALVKLFVPLIICFVGYQTYQTYQYNHVIEGDLSQVVSEFRAAKIITDKEVRGRISSILESHGTSFDPTSFTLNRDEAKPELSFSVDYKKSPNLLVMSYPISFHVDVPQINKDSSALGGLVSGSRKTVEGADNRKKEDLQKVDSALNQ